MSRKAKHLRARTFASWDGFCLWFCQGHFQMEIWQVVIYCPFMFMKPRWLNNGLFVNTKDCKLGTFVAANNLGASFSKF